MDKVERVGIVMDDYKVPIFRVKLRQAGFKWSESKGLTKKTTAFFVNTDDREKLQRVVEQSNKATRKRMQQRMVLKKRKPRRGNHGNN